MLNKDVHFIFHTNDAIPKIIIYLSDVPFINPEQHILHNLKWAREPLYVAIIESPAVFLITF